MTDKQLVEKAYRLWVNPTRTVLIRMWPGGTVEIARRDDQHGTWGAPEIMEEEK